MMTILGLAAIVCGCYFVASGWHLPDEWRRRPLTKSEHATAAWMGTLGGILLTLGVMALTR